MRTLDLTGDPVALTAALVDLPSVSGDEAAIADEVERALREQAGHLEILRNGDAVLARTDLGRPSRVLLAGHLDTVPIAGNLPSRRDASLLYGCGSCDMKGGDAVILHLAATVSEPNRANSSGSAESPFSKALLAKVRGAGLSGPPRSGSASTPTTGSAMSA